MVTSFILLIVLIILSGFFSSSETAYSSLNKVRLKKYVNDGKRGSEKALKLVLDDNFDKTLSTILIANNIVNIAAASFSAKMATDLVGGNAGVLINTAIMTVLILIFGEILPKSLAKEHAETYAMAISSILFVLFKTLAPINYFFLRLKEVVSKIIAKDQMLPSITEEEIKLIVGIGEKEGIIDKSERQLIHRSMKLDETAVREILTPRTDMVAINSNQSVEEIKDVFFRERYSRIPVYENSIDNIIGFITEKEFLTHLLKSKDIRLKELIREPLFVAESMKISTLLPRLQKEKIPIAIVINEFGGTVGIVTLEDVLEEIVGEILDENEEETNQVSKINDRQYIFSSNYYLRDFASFLNVPLPKSSYFTLGGWTMENLEEIPKEGDSFHYQNLTICVDQVASRRVTKLRVEVHPIKGANNK
ncbi:Hemolysin, contains CBS domains [Oceanobacillus limi]|uniref:Hemolysin, contains CBS domains n=1 Tax=Oceanobacillus limi TaxID=930131 RepID=A0A1I0CTY7_9BACI|nr:hemolysin family protein [Oceanobacillus limi]SET23063.1 Hemolysin, contains CBS domains [Oceanobacillus limi]